MDISELRYDIQILSEGVSTNREDRTIFDPVADKYFKVTQDVIILMGFLNKSQSIEELTAKLEARQISITPDRIQQIVIFLANSNLFVVQPGATEEKVLKIKKQKEDMKFHAIMNMYISVKIPLLRPEKLLNNTIGFIKAIFNKWTLIILSLISLFGYIEIMLNAEKFFNSILQSINIAGLTKYAVLMIFLKIFHEFTHAYIAKGYGVKVRRMGIAIIFLMPRLYCDVTDSWRASRTARIWIDSGGILFELMIGGICAVIWANSPQGVISTICYYVVAISMLNTIFCNGNPFIRFDGYYILSDIVGIDNLAKRAIDAFKTLYRKILFGLPGSVEDLALNKKIFLVFFAICSFTYKLFLYTSIIIMVYFQFTKAIGLLLAVFEFYLMLWKPFYKELIFLIQNRAMMKKKNLFITISTLIILIIIFIIPFPWNIASVCEIKIKEPVIITIKEDGFLNKNSLKNGSLIKKGDILFHQKNNILDYAKEKELLEIKQIKLQIDQVKEHSEKRNYLKILEQKLISSEKKLKEIERKKELLVTKSDCSGEFYLYNENIGGAWLKKGTPVAEIINKEYNIRAFINEEYIDKIKVNDNIVMRFNDSLLNLTGTINKISRVTKKEFSVPTMALMKYGGKIATYPQNNILEVVEPIYEIDIKISEPEKANLIERSGIVEIEKKYSLFELIRMKVTSMLIRIFSF